MSLHDTVAAELAAAQARRAAESIERSARLALRICGWDAPRARIETYAEDLPAKRRTMVLARAFELQSDAGPERRYTRDEIEAYMAKTVIPRETRDKIKLYAREARNRKGAHGPTIHREICEKFGVEITLGNFYASFYSPSAPPPKKDSGRNQTRQPAQPAACAPTTGPTTAPAAAPAAGPSANGSDRPSPVIAGDLRTRPESSDLVKLGPVTVITIRKGELRVAIDYTGPAPTVYALLAAAAAVLAEREAA